MLRTTDKRTKGAFLSLIVTAAVLSLPRADAQSTTDGLCTVSILNQTAFVQDDGTWLIPNVPANMGLVRARVTCVENGQTVSGESELFPIVADRQSSVPVVPLGETSPAPIRIDLESPTTTLTAVGEAVRVSVTALLADGSSVDVSSAADGVTYLSTNPEVATVGADGNVVAQASGRVFITALYDATIDTLPIEVVVSGDSDGDGLPDDFELRNGLDPNDPVDALEDPDRDGLSTIDELDRGLDPNDPDSDGDGLLDGEEVATTGTNPALFDTDGDGLSDGLEIRTGSDPLDPTSFNLAEALAELRVMPPSIVLVVDALTLDSSRRLDVSGTLLDGTAIDLTPRSRGTRYASSDLTVCNFGAEDGVVFAGRDGLCTVTVTNSGFAATVDVEVTTFTPIGRGALKMPGYANNVDVEDGRAYVAAGAAGLVVVDATDPVVPRIVATLDTPGNANDVKVKDGLAYVADGAAGLLVVDVTNPLAPTLVGSLDTPGEARDVALFGELALVADGPAGLHVVNVADPSAPRLLASLAVPGVARGVDAGGGLAVVAASASGVHVVDLGDPSSPALLASLATTDARDVDLTGSTAWLADFSGGLRSIDLTDPTAPRLLASVPTQFGGIPQDVVIAPAVLPPGPPGGAAAGPLFALTAEVFFARASVPIVEVSDPAKPLPRSVLDFGAELNGTGLAVDEWFVYLTATESFADNGATGESFLFIGQFLGFRDEAGAPPSVRLAAPADGAEVVERQPIVVEVEAADDIGVLRVRVRVDGEIVGEDRNAPYRVLVPAPAAPAVLTIDAEAIDFGGNRAVSDTVTVTVVAKATTSVIGSVADTAGAAVAEAVVSTNLGGAGTTDGGGFFRFDEIPADQGDVVVFATAERGGTTLRGQSPPAAPVAGGFTDVGEIVVAPRDLFPGRKFQFFRPGEVFSDTAPNQLVAGDFDGDGRSDRAGSLSRTIGVLLGRGDGTYDEVRTVDDTGLLVSRIAAADLDGDGRSDLVASHSAVDDVSVRLSLGGGAFGPASRYRVGDQPSRIAAADLDLDGAPEILVSLAGPELSILPGLGGGAFGPERRLALGSSQSLLLSGDLDDDGLPDLLVSDRPNAAVLIFAGRGDGDFDAPRSLPAGLRVTAAEELDFDFDGVRDLFLFGSDPTSGALGFRVLLGRGNGSYSGPVAGIPSSSNPQLGLFQVVDVDQDGLSDVAQLLRDSAGFFFLRIALGAGNLARVDVFAGAVSDFRFGDVDGDGALDLEVAGGGGLKVFRGDGAGGFASFGRHPAASAAGLAAAGDVNGDGVVDLVHAASFPQVVVHLGRPGGGYEAPAAFTAAHTPVGVWVAEVTGDGAADIVTRSLNQIGVLPGLGDGTFGAPLASPLPLTLSNRESAALLADFDGDGVPDFAGARELVSSSREVVLMVNRGDGVFTTAQRPMVGSGPVGLAAADFDGDGRLDLAVTNFSSKDVSVLLNQGGTFAPEIRQPLGQFPGSVVALDANRDGRADLAVEQGSAPLSQLRILLGQGDGTFAGGGLMPTHQPPRHLVAVDLDQDGLTDLVINGPDDVTAFPGRGDGTFGAGKIYATGAVTSSQVAADVLVPADLDGDGRLDLVVRAEKVFHFLLREP